jgi:hypothetical protein
MHQIEAESVEPPEQTDYTILSEDLVCSRESQDCMLHKCSNCSGQSQLQAVAEELLQTNDFYVGDSTVYRQWVYDGDRKITSLTGTARELTEKNLPKSRSINYPQLRSKMTGFMFENVERNHSARQWNCYFT